MVDYKGIIWGKDKLVENIVKNILNSTKFIISIKTIINQIKISKFTPNRTTSKNDLAIEVIKTKIIKIIKGNSSLNLGAKRFDKLVIEIEGKKSNNDKIILIDKE